MGKKLLRIASGLELPAEDFIERATGLIAKRGKGKSGGVKVIEEALIEAGLPFVVFDPVGIHYGLKSDFYGKKPSGHKVLVVGGEHADLPLERKGGRVTARTIADKNVSLIIDFKGTPHAAYREFVADFADELNNVNKHPRLLIFEEVSRLLPQRIRPDQTASFDAVTRLVLEGRNVGLGCILISQRAATVNKDVLTQVDNLIVMGITGPQDRKAVKEWVEENADEDKLDDFLTGLSALQPREAWLWAPDMGLFQKFRFKDFTTFHPDRTHLRRLGLLDIKPVLTDVSSLVAALKGELATVIEKAKDDDPKALRAEIARLKAEAARLPTLTKVETKVETKIVEVPALTKEDRKLFEKVEDRIVQEHNRLRGTLQTVHDTLSLASDTAKRIREALDKAPPVIATLARVPPKVPPYTFSLPVGNISKRSGAPVASVPKAPQRNGDAETGGLKKAERKLLAVLSQFPEGCDANKLILLAGYRWTGGTRNALGTLRTHGLIVGENDQVMSATPVGRALAPSIPEYEAIPTGEALKDYWLNHKSFKLAQRTILKAFVDHPKGLTAEQVCEATGYQWTGGTRNALGDLRTAGLIVGKNSETMRLSDEMLAVVAA